MAVGLRSFATSDTKDGPWSLVAGTPLEEVAGACARIAQSQAPVLLTGPSGPAKELLARFVHASSVRAEGPFVALDVAAIPPALVESELYGYVKGAFPGAASPRRGRLMMAESGTLFLDGVGELSPELQLKLLRLLSEHRYLPLGADLAVPADIRLVAASDRVLAAEVGAGRFRRDLYFRLNVCPVRVPELPADGRGPAPPPAWEAIARG